MHSGASGLGLLSAAPAAGALCTVMTTGLLRRAHRLGRIVMLAVAAWGAAITVAGLLGVFWAPVLLLAVAGDADAVSAICRSTIVQSTTPDHLRGRVGSASSMVVVGSPYVGDLEAGAVGAAFTPQVSFVGGGLLCLAGIGAVALAFPELWALDSAHGALPDVRAPSTPVAAPQG